MKTKVLAFDQATKTGWAFGTEDGLVDSGRLTMPKRENGQRLEWLRAEAIRLAGHFAPDLMVCEKPFIPVGGDAAKGGGARFNPDVIRWSAKVEGVIEMAASAVGCPLDVYSPDAWRGTLLGYSRRPKGSEKDHMKVAVIQRLRSFGHKIENDDQADAIGLMYHALHGAPASARKQGDLLAMASGNL